MDLNALATEVAFKVVQDTKFWTATIAFLGVAVGAGITAATTFGIHWLKERPQQKLDAARKDILKHLLMDRKYEWRKLDTLARVVGTNAETARRLLIEIGARGSEGEAEVWALIERKPLEATAQ